MAMAKRTTPDGIAKYITAFLADWETEFSTPPSIPMPELNQWAKRNGYSTWAKYVECRTIQKEALERVCESTRLGQFWETVSQKEHFHPNVFMNRLVLSIGSYYTRNDLPSSEKRSELLAVAETAKRLSLSLSILKDDTIPLVSLFMPEEKFITSMFRSDYLEEANKRKRNPMQPFFHALPPIAELLLRLSSEAEARGNDVCVERAGKKRSRSSLSSRMIDSILGSSPVLLSHPSLAAEFVLAALPDSKVTPDTVRKHHHYREMKRLIAAEDLALAD